MSGIFLNSVYLHDFSAHHLFWIYLSIYPSSFLHSLYLIVFHSVSSFFYHLLSLFFFHSLYLVFLHLNLFSFSILYLFLLAFASFLVVLSLSIFFLSAWSTCFLSLLFICTFLSRTQPFFYFPIFFFLQSLSSLLSLNLFSAVLISHFTFCFPAFITLFSLLLPPPPPPPILCKYDP